MIPILTRRFRKDVFQCIKWSAAEFGHNASIRYENLIDTALSHIAKDPFLSGSRKYDQVRLYHLKHSKNAAAVNGIIVKKPRHVIAYKLQDDDNQIVALRLLYDRMDLERHIP